ncbi:apolipoprotein N-acyltransferase [Nonomuraea sp. NPDC050643]|uniref:apolipoprotein N-acyltransferase n=1 Tax=Nonomuraea sp. NPDC050643 TaxID=3155660 RepID=UPI0033EE5939
MVQDRMGLAPTAGRDSTPAADSPPSSVTPGEADPADVPAVPTSAASPAPTSDAAQAPDATPSPDVTLPSDAALSSDVVLSSEAAGSSPADASEAGSEGASVPVSEKAAPGGGEEPAGAAGSPSGGEVPGGRGGAAGERPEARWVLGARVLAAIAGGLALYAAFPPLDWWLCAPLGIGLIIASLRGTRPRRAAWLGYLAALVFLLPALAWVRTIGDDVWAMLVATESLFYAAMAALAALVFRLRWWPLWFGGLWVAMEWARGLVPIGGFPWARVAFSQGESPFTPYAALGGAPLVSFAVAVCGGLLAHAALTRSALLRRAVPVGLALVVPVLGLLVPRPGDEGRAVNVGIVQGNVPGRGMNVLGDEPAVVLRNHANETKRLAQAVREGRLPKPDLVVLPENSTDIDPYRDAVAREIIHDSVKDVGVPTLVGAVVSIGDEHRATRSLVWDPVTGAGDYYDKQRLVPFGEYTPFKEIVLALWERAGLVGRQSVPGDKPGDLKLGPVTVGAVNCYEVAYDDTVRDTVRAGGTPIVVQTNNATYALSNLPPQQLAMSKLRAVEHNRAVVTAATTGISAYVTPDGKVSWQTRELVADMNVVKVPVRTQETIATRVGALPEWALMMMGVAAAGVAAWRGRRRDRTRATG